MSSSTTRTANRTTGHTGTALVVALVFIALVGAVIGSLGAPLITAVAQQYQVSLMASQWTLTITLLSGAVTTPLLGRLGSDRRSRPIILATLVIVVAGSVATVVPAPFAVLLLGRAAQGVGMGLIPLLMATARQHLGQRAPSTIALLSVATTVGIGIGYPLAGLLTQVSGIRSAYLLGLIGTVAALITAVVTLPRDTDNPQVPRAGSMDWTGAALLSFGLVAVLLVTSSTALWTSYPAVAAVVLTAGVTVLVTWVIVERRSRRPLVNVNALRHPAVAGANLVMGVSGIAMYLLFTLITRYMQTPPAVGYGYGLSDLEAGLVLVPFSALGFLAGRVVPRLRQRVSPFTLLTVTGVVVAAACGLFAATRTLGIAWPIVAMGVLGFGVGGVAATMPQAILAVTPSDESAAAMSINQVIRSVGFSIGSALSGLLLAVYTPAGQFTPDAAGYTATAWVGTMLAVLGVGLATATGSIRRRREPTTPG